MTESGLWYEPLYRETSALIILFLVIIYALLFFLRKKFPKTILAKASLKSWFFMAPLILVVVGLPYPYPLIFLAVMAIFGAKTFFRMTGMYHRSWFVWTTYIFIIALGIMIEQDRAEAYDLMPAFFIGAISFIPLLRNSARHMIQYMALSLMAFIFVGWGFMYLGRILMLDQGIYIVLYLLILSEFCEAVSLGANRFLGRVKPFQNITTRFSIEGLLVSVFFTLLLAWGMRHMLPDRSEEYWISAGIVVALFGRFGGLMISVIRRDLGIKDSGVFILGRDDILARIDKQMFVAPIFYYVFLHLQGL